MTNYMVKSGTALIMMYHCMHSQAPWYLTDHLTPASEVASRLCLHSINQHQLILPRCQVNTYAVGIFQLLVWLSGTDELLVCGLDSFKQYLKTILFRLY